MFGADRGSGAPNLSMSGATGTNVGGPFASRLPVTAPIDGVITAIRLDYGATNGTPGFVGFRLLSGTSPTFTARHATHDGGRMDFPLMPNSAGRTITYAPNDDEGRRTGVPVAAGEHLAVYQLKPAGGVAPIAAESSLEGVRATNSDHESGTRNYGTNVGGKVFVDALVEPDADQDEYGDETQDNCPSIANDQTSNPCPKEVVVERETVTVPGPTRTVPGPTVTVPGPAPAPIVVPGPPVVGPSSARLCTVPRLKGLSIAAATARLRGAGCAAGRVVGTRSSRARVRTQTVPAGTRVEAGTRVGFAVRGAPRARVRSRARR